LQSFGPGREASDAGRFVRMAWEVVAVYCGRVACRVLLALVAVPLGV
jgi:hypothetical protein